MIQCSKLSKDFKIYTKKRGFKGTLASFVKREYRIKPAVKDSDLNLDSPGPIDLGPNRKNRTRGGYR